MKKKSSVFNPEFLKNKQGKVISVYLNEASAKFLFGEIARLEKKIAAFKKKKAKRKE
jgi:hypothetical protein